MAVKLLPTLVILTYCLITMATVSGNVTATVTVNKCCPADSYMSPKTGYQCTSGTQRVWSRARVYNLRQFLPEGVMPVTWLLRNDTRPLCDADVVRLPLRNGAAIPFANGSLMVLELGENLIHPNHYCLDYEAVLFCDPSAQVGAQAAPHISSSVGGASPTARVKKCCGQGGVFLEGNRTQCVANSDGYNLLLKQASTSSTSTSEDNDPGRNVSASVVLVGGFPNCEGGMVLGGKVQDAQVFSNGSLRLEGRQDGGGGGGGDGGQQVVVVLGAGQFCLEHVLTDNGTNVTASVFTCPSLLPPAPPSVTRQRSQSADLRLTIYPIALALGAVFLAATLAAGCLLPASHHALHWRCQTNHVACLLLGNVLLCVTQLSGDLREEWLVCFMIAVLMQFLFLAAFFWLNTMCFNIWWTFRDLRPQSLEKSQERWRLRVYEAYAWGGPLLLAGAAAAVDTASDAGALGLLRPGFVRNSCWFAGRNEILTYFYGPIGALLVMNLVLFAATARELTCGLWKRELVKSTSERAALGRVCMKLVVVMGVSWIADVISWAVGGPNELWYITDVVNCLQGVFIFMVVGLQPQVIAAVKRVWCVHKRRRGAGGTEGVGATNHNSSSSQGLPSLGDTLTNNSSVATKTVPLETSC